MPVHSRGKGTRKAASPPKSAPRPSRTAAEHPPEGVLRRQTSVRTLGRFLFLATAIFVILMLRRPGALSNPQFWAEDSIIYFHDQAVYGPLSSVVRLYAGYLQLTQRLIADSAWLFSARFAPLIFTLAATIIGALCCATFFLPYFRHIIRSDALRLSCCILMATTIYSAELVGALVNVLWFMLVAGILLVFRELPDRPVRNLQRLAWGGLGAIMGLTAPLLVIVMPFSIWRLWRKRDGTHWYEVALTLGTLFQIYVFLKFSENVKGYETILKTADYALGAGIAGFMYRGALSTLVGIDWTYDLAGMGLLGFPQIALLIMAFGIAALWVSGNRKERAHILIACYLAFSSIVLSLNGRHYTFPFANINSYAERGGGRYFFLSACVFVYLMALAVSKLLRRRSQPTQVAALFALFALGITQNYPCPAFKDLNWASHASAIDASIRDLRVGKPGAISVPVNPEPWVLKIP